MWKKTNKSDETTRIDSRMVVNRGEVAKNVTVGSGGSLVIMCGGKAKDTIVSSGGEIVVAAGGTIKRTTIGCGAEVIIRYGAKALETEVEKGGMIRVNNDGIVKGISIQSGGVVTINGRALATGINAAQGARLHFAVTSVSHIQGTVNGSAFDVKDGRISDYTVEPGNGLTVSDKCIADRISIKRHGDFYVESGGTATNIVAEEKSVISFDVAPNTCLQGTSNGCSFDIKDTFLSSHTILNGGMVKVFDGGVINDIRMIGPEKESIETKAGNREGFLQVEYDGLVNNLDVSGGYVDVDGGAVNKAALHYGKVVVGGAVNSIDIGGSGTLEVFNNGTVISAESFGKMTVHSGGVIIRNRISDGTLVVRNGGTVNEATLFGGKITVSSGGTVLKIDDWGGEIEIENGARVVCVDKHK